jgi:plastocyanin
MERRSSLRQGSRRGLAVAAVTVIAAGLALVPRVAAASGGGGCGGPVTDAAGASVEIRDFCFTPTILRAAPGDVVTFTNRDPVQHTVLGANALWGGFDTLRRGVATTFQFAEPGIYPYVCTWHPGMIGVVVVGDGVGGAIDTTTAAGPVAAATAQEVELSAATAGRERDGGIGLAAVFCALGLVIGTAGAIGVRRKRQSPLA